MERTNEISNIVIIVKLTISHRSSSNDHKFIGKIINSIMVVDDLPVERQKWVKEETVLEVHQN